MKLDDLCDALERLPLPRADEPVHPDRATVLAARARVGEAVADDEFLADCIEAIEAPTAHELDALEYEAPFLLEKLVEDRVATDAAEARALFREVKRFLVLIRTNEHLQWELCSCRVDEAWHQFMLFSREYIQFCMRYFGGYVQHRPGRASTTVRAVSWLPVFRQRYEAYFGEPLPDVWYDDRSINPHRRVINDAAGHMRVRIEGELVSLSSDAGEALLSTGPAALAALRFIARTAAFYVRELPGKLTDDEQVVLVATLVERQVLRVAP